MDLSLIILIILVVTALLAVLKKGGWPLAIEALKRSKAILSSMWWKVLMGIVLAGLIQVLIPKATIADWIGPATGLTGILIGSVAGMILTGGAFVVIPIIGSIYEAGAGAGPIIALLTAANLTRIQGLFIIEIPIFGMRLSVTRYLVCLPVPPAIGLFGSFLFRLF
jgi:uncharacterized membrane protein YraQ (UPF0718 family)